MTQAATGETRGYTTVAIILHWLIAALLVSMVFYGWWMGDLRGAALDGEMTFSEVQFFYNWHKTAGIAILILSVFRLIWRLTHTVPPMPARMPGWQKTVARATHALFYVLMIGMPLTGWLTASASDFPSYMANIPALELPHLPVSEGAGEILEFIHGRGAWAILILLALHAGAALKHQFMDRDGLLGRMVPALKS